MARQAERNLSLVERTLLEYFFQNLEGLASTSPELDSIVVESRENTGLGFFVTMARCKELYVGEVIKDLTWGDVSGKINNSTDAGFLVFVVEGYVDALEGFSSSGSWPDHITSIDLAPFSGDRY